MHSSIMSVAALALPLVAAASFPDLPFTTSSRDILSASNETVTFAGVNWPGHGEAMIPEGLQYNSIANITRFIKQNLGMNVVRLTFAIEMVDDIFEENTAPLEESFVRALGNENGTEVAEMVLANNPELTAEMTRLEVFDAVAAELARQEVWILLDNHISRAQWCCNADDGNAWFGDTYFDVANWQRGLGFMADHVKSWSSLAGISLRNELRRPEQNTRTTQPYTWPVWLENMVPAAEAVHGNNSEALILFSGLDYDHDIIFLTQGNVIDGVSWEPAEYSFRDQIVYELHNYDGSADSCPDLQEGLVDFGYGAMDVEDELHPNKFPVVMTEFGFNQEDGAYLSVYAQCIRDFLLNLPGGPGGWIQWVIAGTYYIREGTQDFEDPWGLLNRDWSDWRNETVIDEYNRPWVQETLE